MSSLFWREVAKELLIDPAEDNVVYRVRMKCCGTIVEAVLDDLELQMKKTWCPKCQRYSEFEVLKRDVKLPDSASPKVAVSSSSREGSPFLPGETQREREVRSDE